MAGRAIPTESWSDKKLAHVSVGTHKKKHNLSDKDNWTKCGDIFKPCVGAMRLKMLKCDVIKDVKKYVYCQKMIRRWSSVVRVGLITSCWPAIVLTLAEDWISPKFSTSLICPRATFTPPYNCQPTSSLAEPTSLSFSLSLCQHLIFTSDIGGQEGMIRFLEGSIGRSNPWQSCPL